MLLPPILPGFILILFTFLYPSFFLVTSSLSSILASPSVFPCSSSLPLITLFPLYPHRSSFLHSLTSSIPRSSLIPLLLLSLLSQISRLPQFALFLSLRSPSHLPIQSRRRVTQHPRQSHPRRHEQQTKHTGKTTSLPCIHIPYTPHMNSHSHSPMTTEARLQRQLEHNRKLREQFERNRISVSQASILLIQYCQTKRDMLIPTVWGDLDAKDDPFEAKTAGCGCSVM